MSSATQARIAKDVQALQTPRCHSQDEPLLRVHHAGLFFVIAMVVSYKVAEAVCC
eukprot:CAMPEP_0206048178 /NCGR_PEP_ID=MMETSP1466-20131121/23405_1 /ASSEMBLY_ACC=CAM_ASM_001126 /TAXON_ID=44452 /ORGANISM="Pavlova gyrans, Strain CCMP608" /LENGTH=54 /DNA_ID=CAMNT_0053423221 /DNA_START=57 /DNA_END=221 /DNA_ORIENTATION=+